uniref:Uncharacterized protein n=1 Tax=Cacopsylla melanoneura TaxID=428564 RepID=A0A8D9E7W0_9HEMI
MRQEKWHALTSGIIVTLDLHMKRGMPSATRQALVTATQAVVNLIAMVIASIGRRLAIDRPWQFIDLGKKQFICRSHSLKISPNVLYSVYRTRLSCIIVSLVQCN